MAVSKEIIGAFSILVCVIQYVPLIYLTFTGQKKPHAFSRLIWATTFGIAYAAQYVDHGGAGSWSTGVSMLFCCALAVVAMSHRKTYVTRSDWIALIGALLAIPAWLATHNPLTAAIWATAIDLIGYVPAFRKAWHKPHEEMIYSTLIGFVKMLLSVLAMENYSPTTLVYPVAITAADLGVVVFLLWRRHILKKSPAI